MKFRLTIGRKIGTGFGILILLTLVIFVFTYYTLTDSREINDRINAVNTPSVKTFAGAKVFCSRNQSVFRNLD